MEERAIQQCREQIIEIENALRRLDQERAELQAERDRLALAIEAAKDPSVLNRGGRR